MDYVQIFCNRQTDYDRLRSARTFRRGSGHTYTTIVQMVGEVKFGTVNGTYVYVGEGNRQYVRTGIMRPFYQILTHEGFHCSAFIDRGILHVHDTNQYFNFTNADKNLEHQFIGQRIDRLFVDLVPETKRTFRKELNMLCHRTTNC